MNPHGKLLWHLLRCFIAVVVAGVIISLFSDYTFGLLFLDLPFNPNFISNRILCEQAGGAFCTESTVDPMYTSPMEGVMTAITFGAISGFIVAFPYVIWELWRFFRPEFSLQEIRIMRWNIFWLSGLFILGVLCGYFVVLPFRIKFIEIFYFGDANGPNHWKVNSIVKFILFLVLNSGILFQYFYLVVKFWRAKKDRPTLSPFRLLHNNPWGILWLTLLSNIVFGSSLILLVAFIFAEKSSFVGWGPINFFPMIDNPAHPIRLFVTSSLIFQPTMILYYQMQAIRPVGNSKIPA